MPWAREGVGLANRGRRELLGVGLPTTAKRLVDGDYAAV